MKNRIVNKIIIHCSDSNFGSVDEIDRWHRERGFDCIGYHFVVTNGFEFKKSEYSKEFDGIIQIGRNEDIKGAHAVPYNTGSLGICVIGKNHFSEKQLLLALPDLLYRLCKKYNLNIFHDVYPHNYFNHAKTCPNFNLDHILEVAYYRYY